MKLKKVHYKIIATVSLITALSFSMSGCTEEQVDSDLMTALGYTDQTRTTLGFTLDNRIGLNTRNLGRHFVIPVNGEYRVVYKNLESSFNDARDVETDVYYHIFDNERRPQHLLEAIRGQTPFDCVEHTNCIRIEPITKEQFTPLYNYIDREFINDGIVDDEELDVIFERVRNRTPINSSE